MHRIQSASLHLVIQISLVFIALHSISSAKEVESKIAEVTVFTDRAQVIRTAALQLSAGEHTLYFENLPKNIDQNSVQVKGTGKALIKNIGFSKRHYADEQDAQIKPLNRRKDFLTDSTRVLEDQLKLIEKEKQFIEQITNKLTHESEKNTSIELDPVKWIKMVDFYRTRLSSLDKDKREINLTQRTLSAEIDKINRQLNELRDASHKVNTRISVSLENREPTAASLTLSYIVYGAKWTPAYTLRVLSSEKKLAVSYEALVTQTTGEDWTDVDLRLSTAQPSISANIPQLTPWRVNIYNPPSTNMRDARQQAPSALSSAKMMNREEGVFYDEEISADAYVPMNQAQATVETGLTALEYLIEGKSTVKSGSESQNVTITSVTLDADFQYSAVPRLSPYAYLEASAKNTSDFSFLPGEARIFLDNSFIARGNLDRIQPGEAFATSVGIDEGIAVERKLINEYTDDKGVISSKTRITYEYRLTVTNNRKTEEVISIRDQIPLSGNENITIDLQQPDITGETKNPTIDNQNIVKWNKSLKSGEKLELPLKFSITYPKDVQIRGLQ